VSSSPRQPTPRSQHSNRNPLHPPPQYNNEQTVVFKVDYVVEQLGNREFGSVVVEGAAGAPQENAALAVVAAGFAKVRAPGGQGQQQASPFLDELKRAEEAAQAAGLGMWSKDPAALASAVRAAAPSADGAALLAKAGGKGKPVQAVVEAVLNGGLLRVIMLPDLTPASVAVCGVVCPSLNRRPAPGAAAAAPAAAAAAPAAEDGAAATEPASAAAPGSLASKLAGATLAGGPGAPAAGVTEPFAREARWFTEQRLLNREVRLVLEGVDKHGNLFASAYPPAAAAAPAAPSPAPASSSVAEGLVAAGLARTAEWSLAMMTTGAQRLREAERAAKAAKRGLWHNYVPQNTGQTKLSGSFAGKVIEVVSGDTLVIADSGAGGAERRVQLSSVRAPRPGVRDRAPEPYGNDAREFLRRKLVGREVKVQMEYTRKIGGAAGGPGGADAAAAAANERVLQFGNVELAGGGSSGASVVAAAGNGHAAAAGNGSAAANGNGAAAPAANGGIEKEELRNAAELIVARGLATVIRHRADEERSSVYERLVQLEESAKKGKRGLHSPKEPPAAPRLNDVSGAGGAARAKQYLPFLQRAGRVPAVVEYVLSGHRLKVHIPKEGVSIAFAPSGVRAPSRAQPAQGGRPATQGEPYADEALSWTRAHFMQRDVEIEVEGMDKGGTFLGSVYLVGRGGGGGGGHHGAAPGQQLSLGPALLRAGLAKLTGFFSPDRVRGGEALLEAQQQAKEARRKVWENWTPEQDAAAAAAARGNGDDDDDEDASAAASSGGVKAGASFSAASAASSKPVVVTEMVADGSGDFFVQQADEPRVAWVADQLNSKGGALAPAAGAPLPVFTKGQLIAAQFSLDGAWYRAYVESVSPTTEPRYEVFFVDYGNRERVPSAKARALEASVAAVPPLAQPAALAHVRLPPADSEHAPEASDLLASLLGGGRRLEAVVAARVRPEAPDRHPARSQPKVMLVLREAAKAGGAKKGGGDDDEGGKAGSSADAAAKRADAAADDDSPPTFNAEMLLAGMARLPSVKRIRDPREREAVVAMQAWQDAARRAHRGIWEYGDVDDSDDEAEAARAARFGGGGRGGGRAGGR
jgi:staphylococcal nuclease domain-containing protein 1